MSLEVELHGKAGRVCPEALSGEKHCPLIVRTTSEDVMTGTVFGALKHIRPHLWLGPTLNLGLGVNRFRQVWYKNLSIRFWERQERYPPELLEFREGRTEPDIIIEWENPPTTVWIEAKYHAELAWGTANKADNDQVIRGIRTLLAATGHIQPDRLFNIPKRDAIWLALLTYKPDPLVEQYRKTPRLMKALAGPKEPTSLPTAPFVGTITWQELARVLRLTTCRAIPTEASMISVVLEYLESKFNVIEQHLLSTKTNSW